MVGTDGYPTEKELEFIENFDPITNDICELIRFVHSIWWAPEWGFNYDPKTMDLELHTGGWSGNESIICALETNKKLFWALFWQKSLSGGHYWFNLDLYDKTGTRNHVRERIY
jgi:hypothetical protein